MRIRIYPQFLQKSVDVKEHEKNCFVLFSLKDFNIFALHFKVNGTGLSVIL